LFTIVASDLSYLTGKKVAGARGCITEQNVDGIRVLRAYTFPSLHRSFIWRVVSFLSFMVTSVWAGLRAGKVDVVMGTSPPIFQAVSAWLVAALRRRPFLLEIRDLWPEFAIDMGVLRSPILIRFSRWLEGWLYRRADQMLVNSPAYRDYLIRKGIPASKVAFIANGVDPDMFDPESDGASVREQLGLGGKFVVVYAGALGMANDIPTLLRAADRLKSNPEIQFLLVGDGKDRPALKAQARKMGLANVLFTGAQPKSDMRHWLAAADACLAILKDIPMFRTTYPNKVFDYMAAGRPTILAIDGVIRDVIETAGAGMFVPPGREDLLAQAVETLSADRVRCREMGQRARAHVCLRFDRHQQAKELLSLLETTASGR